MKQGRNIYIDAGLRDMRRPEERPRKSDWKIELLKKGLRIYQYIDPAKVAGIIWHFFTKPVAAHFTDNQKVLLEKAEVRHLSYHSHRIVAYKWGTKGPKVLLSHGWNSKVADFRRMITSLVEAGFVVEGIDMKAHGQSEGKKTALPEFRDILKDYYVKNGPYHAVLGYSLGGIAAGIVMSEISRNIQPENLIIISAPPYVRYFFENIVKNDVGCNHTVYEEMCGMVQKIYHQSIDYFDLRDKKAQLNSMNLHLIYDENDKTVPFERGEEMRKHYPSANWVHTKGLGHYRIIAYEKVIEYIREQILPLQLTESEG